MRVESLEHELIILRRAPKPTPVKYKIEEKELLEVKIYTVNSQKILSKCTINSRVEKKAKTNVSVESLWKAVLQKSSNFK